MQVGIDVGATKIESVVLEKDGQEKHRSRISCPKNYTQIMNQYYKYLIQVYLLQKLVKPEIFQLFFFSTPKQNPADKRYMPQKHPQLCAVAAYMCCSQPGQYRLSNLFSMNPKNSFYTAICNFI